jgi:hypothetical protein
MDDGIVANDENQDQEQQAEHGQPPSVRKKATLRQGTGSDRIRGSQQREIAL